MVVEVGALLVCVGWGIEACRRIDERQDMADGKIINLAHELQRIDAHVTALEKRPS